MWRCCWICILVGSWAGRWGAHHDRTNAHGAHDGRAPATGHEAGAPSLGSRPPIYGGAVPTGAQAVRLAVFHESAGNCWDHAVVESFFASLKTELTYRRRFRSRQEAQTAIFTYIEGFYNRRRRHSTSGYLSPVEFRMASVVSRELVSTKLGEVHSGPFQPRFARHPNYSSPLHRSGISYREEQPEASAGCV